MKWQMEILGNLLNIQKVRFFGKNKNTLRQTTVTSRCSNGVK